MFLHEGELACTRVTLTLHILYYGCLHADVGSENDVVPLAIVIPPIPTTAVQGDDVSVALECVANARYVPKSTHPNGTLTAGKKHLYF